MRELDGGRRDDDGVVHGLSDGGVHTEPKAARRQLCAGSSDDGCTAAIGSDGEATVLRFGAWCSGAMATSTDRRN